MAMLILLLCMNPPDPGVDGTPVGCSPMDGVGAASDEGDSPGAIGAGGVVAVGPGLAAGGVDMVGGDAIVGGEAMVGGDAMAVGGGTVGGMVAAVGDDDGCWPEDRAAKVRDKVSMSMAREKAIMREKEVFEAEQERVRLRLDIYREREEKKRKGERNHLLLGSPLGA